MIIYTPGFAPKHVDEPAVDHAVSAKQGDMFPSADEAMALAAARQTQVLSYTRTGSTQSPLVQNLRQDGPILEQWLASGYQAENYPPQGYAELDSAGLRAYKAAIAQIPAPAPHSVNDKPEESI